MMTHDADDELLRTLASLRVLDPDAARRERLRARAHATLAHGREREERRRSRARFASRVLEPALVGGLSVGYLLAILVMLLKVHRIL